MVCFVRMKECCWLGFRCRLITYNALLYLTFYFIFSFIHADLGTITIEPKALMEAKGERMVFKLNPPLKQEGKDAGHIAIRCRPATNYDREFLNSLKDKSTSAMLGIDESYEAAMKTSSGGGAKLLQKNFMVGK